MSLTSYRAAPSRVIGRWSSVVRTHVFLKTDDRRLTTEVECFGRPGGDRLSHVLRHSIIGAGDFHGRVRDGIGCRLPAMATRSSKALWSSVVGHRLSEHSDTPRRWVRRPADRFWYFCCHQTRSPEQLRRPTTDDRRLNNVSCFYAWCVERFRRGAGFLR